MPAIDDAFQEYIAKRTAYIRGTLQATRDGFFVPPVGDTCMDCVNARWTSNSGSHLKSVEHIAKKHGVRVSELRYLVVAYDLQQAVIRATNSLSTFSTSASGTALTQADMNEAIAKAYPSSDVGWKSLGVGVDDNMEPILVSYHDDFQWKPNEVTWATCFHREQRTVVIETLQGTERMLLPVDGEPTLVPNDGRPANVACMEDRETCGLYFFWKPPAASDYQHSKRTMVIRATLGGTVIECEEGCRAQCAVITGIVYEGHRIPIFIKKMAELYNVPVINTEGGIYLWDQTP